MINVIIGGPFEVINSVHQLLLLGLVGYMKKQ